MLARFSLVVNLFNKSCFPFYSFQQAVIIIFFNSDLMLNYLFFFGTIPNPLVFFKLVFCLVRVLGLWAYFFFPLDLSFFHPQLVLWQFKNGVYRLFKILGRLRVNWPGNYVPCCHHVLCPHLPDMLGALRGWSKYTSRPTLPTSLDHLQFVYSPNPFPGDIISITLHSVLSHHDTKDTYAKKLFTNINSALRLIIPQVLGSMLGLIPHCATGFWNS